MSNYRIAARFAALFTTALATGLMSVPAWAVNEASGAAESNEEAIEQPIDATAGEAPDASAGPGESEEDDFNVIIVTGTVSGQSKFDTSYAITSLSNDALVQLAPLNTADLLGQIRGVYAEATGGEASNVYRVRGIPNEGSFYAFQEDGIPIYPESAGWFFTGDGITRTDLMTERFEAVIGGPAPVFATNASAIFNNVTRQGDDFLEGAVQTTIGDTGLFRGDAYLSGPLGENTYFAVGGFYRYHEGYRDNGYPSDEGGQARLNLRHEFDRLTIRAHAKYFNDRNTFYLPIPLADPRDPSRSLGEFVDFFEGTLNTPALADGNALFRFTDASGVIQEERRSLDDARRTEYFTTGLELDWDVTDTIRVVNRFRYTDGSVDFDAIYSSANPIDGDDFAASRLAAAQSAFGPDVVRLGYAIAGTGGTLAYDPDSDSGLVIPVDYRNIQSDWQSFQNDFRVTADFALLGDHELTLGVNFAHFETIASWRSNEYLFQVLSQPSPLDLVALDEGGNPLGFVTDDGVLRYSSTLLAGNSTVDQWDLYVADTWFITPDFSLEAGLRHTFYDGTGNFRAPAPFNLGDPTTLADDFALGFVGVDVPNAVDIENTSWTIGANWTVNDWLGLYARASRANRGPNEFNLILPFSGSTTTADQYEAGIKLRLATLSVFATAFYSEFDPFSSSIATTGDDGNIEFVDFVGSIQTPGVEVEFSWRPLDFFTFDGTVTYADAQLGNFTNVVEQSVLEADGNQPIRQPRFYGNLRPAFNFDIGGFDTTVFSRFNFVGRRFVDLANSTEMPAYETLAAGISIEKGPILVQLVGENLTNARGITEGNPRNDALFGQGASQVIYGRPLFGRNFRLTATYSF
ncbi:MAG: TonB-dependent receptor [Erythrobacter sp.]|jgi:outer membrane receptor protein involved in Fe transport|nr:TonB-dependent receptor [Erythrobacter sp.]